MAAQHATLTVFLVSLCLSQVASDSFYIKTSSDQPCPQRYQPAQCMTLQQYITNSTLGNLNITDEIHLELQSGQHNVSVPLLVYNASFHMNSTNATLHCTMGNSNDSVNFTHAHTVSVTGISFFNCGNVTFQAVSNVVFQNCRFQESGPLVLTLVSNGTVINSWFQSGYGIKLFDSSMKLKQSHFSNLTATTGSTLIHPLQPQCDQRGGGAISSCNSTLMVNTCFFTHNVALNGAGGAILADNASLTINNSSFTSNTASRAGGAIYTHRSLLEVHQSKFISNSVVDIGPIDRQAESSEGGGAIFVNTTKYDIDIINGSLFSMNTARGKSGGALHVYSNRQSYSVSIGYSVFEQNTASRCAAFKSDGANYTTDAIVFVDGSSFTNNTASDSGGVGCIINADISTLDNSNFKYNKASRNAGVLHIENSKSLTADNSHFVENSAGQNGGAMYTASSPITIDITHSLFDRNQAQRGRVVDVEGGGSFVSIRKSTLTFNGPGDAGGVIAINDSRLSIRQSNISTLSDMDVVVRACNYSYVEPNDVVKRWYQEQNSTCILYVKYTTAIPTSTTSGTSETTEQASTTAARESGGSSSKTVTATLVLVIILFVLVAILYVMVTAITLCLYSMIKGKRGDLSNPNVYVPIPGSDTDTT